MDASKLDDFSLAIARRLFVQFPEWRDLAQVERAEDGSGFLRLQIPAPVESAVDSGLTFTTSNGEVTVEFDYYHGHFFDQVGDGEHFGADYALHLLSLLMAEEISVVSWWFEGKLVAFSTIESGKPVMDAELVGTHDRVRIRSWRGNLNVDRNV